MLLILIQYALADLLPPPTPHYDVQETLNRIHNDSPYIKEASISNCSPNLFPTKKIYGSEVAPGSHSYRQIVDEISYVQCDVCQANGQDPTSCARQYASPKWWWRKKVC